MKKIINSEVIEGRLYQYNLVKKKVQNKESKNYGTDFISGTVSIATDEEGLNVLDVHYTYKTEITSNGKKDASYAILDSILNGGAKTWLVDGKDAAMKVRCTPSLALNDFVSQNGEMVAAKVNESGFINPVRGELSPEDQRNTFNCDMLITNVFSVDATDDVPAYVRVKGAVFSFRGDLLPVEFVCKNVLTGYFEGLDVSPANPVLTRVTGHIFNSTITRKIEEEGAFGLVSVKTITRNVKEYVIDWAIPTEYEFGAEDVMTRDELKKAIQDREVYLASVKKRHDDYITQRNAAPFDSAAPTVAVENFDF